MLTLFPSEISFFGNKLILIDVASLAELMLRFLFDLIVLFAIVRGIYYRARKRRDYFFSFFLFNVLVFAMCILLNNVEVGMGFAFGLFAIFGILRYRTETIPIREMTYFFIVITIAVINGMSNELVSISELLFINGIILALTFALERAPSLRGRQHKTIIYEKIELIKPDKREELLKDLIDRTGLNINRIRIRGINFLRDTANIEIFYTETQDEDLKYN